ncbi:MAG: hypothetical protein PVH17_10095 [Anaerolineae bacterium]|jgi:hypothetical protein
MNAYLPREFLQVALHQRGGNPARLDELFRLLEQLAFKPVVGIDLQKISKRGLLLLPTRQCRFPFEQGELDFIVSFLSQGNPLFHLSNHPPLTKQDTSLGQLLGYRFHSVVNGTDPHCDFEVYPTPHSVSVFESVDANLHFSIRNSCIVTYDNDSFSVIADFSRSNLSNGDPNAAFGIARPRNLGTGAGAIVALGDSGLLGEPMSGNPGPGLHAGDNLELVKRILRWLQNQTAQRVD